MPPAAATMRAKHNGKNPAGMVGRGSSRKGASLKMLRDQIIGTMSLQKGKEAVPCGGWHKFLPSKRGRRRQANRRPRFRKERDLLPVITKTQSVGRSKSWATTLLKRFSAVSVLLNFKSVHSKDRSTFGNSDRRETGACGTSSMACGLSSNYAREPPARTSTISSVCRGGRVARRLRQIPPFDSISRANGADIFGAAKQKGPARKTRQIN